MWDAPTSWGITGVRAGITGMIILKFVGPPEDFGLRRSETKCEFSGVASGGEFTFEAGTQNPGTGTIGTFSQEWNLKRTGLGRPFIDFH